MRRIIAIFSFVIPLLIAFPASALEGGISGIYEYDGERINDVEVDLYKIADYDGSDFRFIPPYESFAVEIGKLTNSELGEYGQLLAAVVNEPDATMQTADGVYSFADMEEGIWLVTFKDIKIGDYTYTALPIVLTMPDLNFNYQIELTTKLEKSCPDCIEPEPDEPPEEDNSNTRDMIQKYITIFSICIVVEMLMLYVIIKGKKKGPNEEK